MTARFNTALTELHRGARVATHTMWMESSIGVKGKIKGGGTAAR